MTSAGAVTTGAVTSVQPWRDATGISLGLVGVALAVQLAVPHLEVRLPPAPGNWLVVFAPLFALAVQQRCFSEHYLIRCLGGVPMAVCSLLLVALVSSPGAIWPQGEQAPVWLQRMGLGQIFRSLPFAVALSLALMNLALVCAKRAWPLSVGNCRFLLIHLGLLLAMAAAVAGTGSFQRSHLVLPLEMENSSFRQVAGDAGNAFPLPFGVRVLEFEADRFPPTVALVHRDEQGRVEMEHGDRLMEESSEEHLGAYVIHVDAYIEGVAVEDATISYSDSLEAGPALYVQVEEQKNGKIAEGWLHAATPVGEELGLPLDAQTLLVMVPPESRRYASRIEVKPDSAAPHQATVQVNQPLRIEGWWLYQAGYGRMDDGSAYVVFETIRDPALPWVYLGFGMLLTGVLWFAWGAATNSNVLQRQLTDKEGS